MNYGTEWYEVEFNSESAKRVQAMAEAWVARWPNYCKHCGGRGAISWNESVPYGSTNASMPMSDVCDYCTGSQDEGAQKCARCGEMGLGDEGQGPCARCGWNYDDALPEW